MFLGNREEPGVAKSGRISRKGVSWGRSGRAVWDGRKSLAFPLSELGSLEGFEHALTWVFAGQPWLP